MDKRNKQNWFSLKALSSRRLALLSGVIVFFIFTTLLVFYLRNPPGDPNEILYFNIDKSDRYPDLGIPAAYVITDNMGAPEDDVIVWIALELPTFGPGNCASIRACAIPQNVTFVVAPGVGIVERQLEFFGIVSPYELVPFQYGLKKIEFIGYSGTWETVGLFLFDEGYNRSRVFIICYRARCIADTDVDENFRAHYSFDIKLLPDWPRLDAGVRIKIAEFKQLAADAD